MSKKVVVTGATSGIGWAISLKLASLGCTVHALGRRAERLSELRAREPKIIGHVLDVTATDVAAQFDALALLDADVLINNAGLALGMAKAHEVSEADADTMIDTNVKALVHVTQAFLPKMVARNAGQVVMLGSVAGTYPYPGGNVYGATKAFVEQYTLGIRADLQGTRVRVTNIEPGMVKTEFSEVRFKGDHAKAAAVYAGVDALTADDIAETVAFCVQLPERVNINRLEVMSVAQSFAGFAFHRA
jgi:3-hydroxy acid dehydrogenase / malonic semialdehyde reductase